MDDMKDSEKALQSIARSSTMEALIEEQKMATQLQYQKYMETAGTISQNINHISSVGAAKQSLALLHKLYMDAVKVTTIGQHERMANIQKSLNRLFIAHITNLDSRRKV